MPTKTFNISFPKQLADEIDKKAKEQFGSRSDFLRMAAAKYLREEREFKELMAYGKRFGDTADHQTEEDLADYITAERRKKEPWRQKAQSSTRR
jgi:metal-responsive CopG/Arc/MetJ family transcriptional regulator